MLEIRDLVARRGDRSTPPVLCGVDLQVAAGEIVALLGRNGSGRSTLAQAIMGLLPAQGSVRWQGQQCLGRPPHAVARAGLAYLAETRDIFSRLTVRENLLLAQALSPRARPRGRSNRRGPTPAFDEVLSRFPALSARLDVPGEALSGGEQQMLALCRVWVARPAAVVLDEPTEGLAPAMVQAVADCLRQWKAEGVAVLMIEQKWTLALQVADRVLVMGRGRIVHEDSPAGLIANDAVRREWLEV